MLAYKFIEIAYIPKCASLMIFYEFCFVSMNWVMLEKEHFQVGI